MKQHYHVMFDGRMITGKISGVARHLINLISGLNEVAPQNKYSVILYDKEALELFGDKLELIWAKHPFTSIYEFFEIPKIISKYKPDIFHSPYYSPIIPIEDVPSLITVHDLINITEEKNLFKRFYRKMILKKACRIADRVLTLSENSKELLSKELSVGSKYIDVVYSAVQEKFFKELDPVKMQEIKKKYNLPEKYVLYVGKGGSYRNLENTIDAYLDSGVEAPLVVSLYWPQLNEFCKSESKPDKIICIGPVSDQDLPYVYRGASLFLFLSLVEGFALPVVEAFASKVPVITSNISSLPEISRSCAVEVDPKDISGISAAIKIAMADDILRNRNVDCGFERAKFFTAQKLAERVIAIYERILSEYKI
jgi:glycosyltransferase involved in cell wall biosynthesis